MNDGIQVFVRAYELHEGAARVTALEKADGSKELRSGGSPAWRNNNPGNLRPSKYNKEQIGEAWGFAVFPDVETGLAAMAALLDRPLYTKLNLEKAIYKYAPPADNNHSHAYALYVSERSGVGLWEVLGDLSQDRMTAVVTAMTEFERSVSGRVRRVVA